MANHCKDCGSKLDGGACPWCHEEMVILDQYHELGMDLPNEKTEFMQKARKQQKEVKNGTY